MASFKRNMHKAVKQAHNTAKYYLQFYLFSSIYLLGLTALIPAVLINAAPTELGFWSGTPLIISCLALFFVVLSIWLILRMHNKTDEGFLALARITLIPGIVAIAVSLGITSMVTSIVYGYIPDLSKVQPLIDLYLESVVPHVWFLTLGYLSVGGVWYLLAKAKE